MSNPRVSPRFRTVRAGAADRSLLTAAQTLIDPIKEFIARPAEERAEYLDDFCAEMTVLVGAVESKLPAENTVMM